MEVIASHVGGELIANVCIQLGKSQSSWENYLNILVKNILEFVKICRSQSKIKILLYATAGRFKTHVARCGCSFVEYYI